MEKFPFKTGYIRKCVVLALCLFSTSAFAQVVWTDADYVQSRGKAPEVLSLRADEPDTIAVTLATPFVDDFSYDQALPDSNRWYIPEIDFRVPRVVRNSALTPPTAGTIRFDGLRRSGIPYETFTLTSGLTDRLVSHYLDLSGLSVGDNIRLYLYVESGGRCESPESTDSFRVNLITPTDTFVLSALGGDLADGNTWVSVSLNRAEYFSPLAQLVLESEGSQNGLLDVWQVDYVYLGQEWPGGIPALDDQSVIRLLSSPLEPYFALPLKLYQRIGGWQTAQEIEVRQNAQTTFSGTLHSEFSNDATTPVGLYFSDNPFTVAGSTSQSVAVPAISDQSPEQSGPWQSIHYFTGHSDRLAANDTLITTIAMDSTMGYDDGMPDKVFGLSKSLGFGVKFDLPDIDTATAVWMQFSPLVYTNGVNGTITYLEDKVFRLRMWNYPHPDSFFLEQVVNMNVTYAEEGTYVRFELSSEVEVPSTFWVGLQQLDGIPIGLGLDTSYDRDLWAFRDSSGHWVNMTLDAAPMIRLELASLFTPQVAAIQPSSGSFALPPSVLGNPLHAGDEIVIQHHERISDYTGSLLDLQGRVLFQLASDRPSGKMSDVLPSELSAGMYLWRHVWKINGQTFIHTERLLIQP